MDIVIFLTIFILTYLAIIFRPLKIRESFYAVFGILLLIFFNVFDLSDALSSLHRFEVVEPYSIIIFFSAFAVLSVGLDHLGFFEYLSVRAIKLAKHDGLKLYKYLFILSAVTSYVAANDIVILTLTPFILYFAKYAKINVRGYLIAMFIVANTASIGQITSNPTNFIVATSYNMGFLENMLIMIVPTIIGLLAIYFILKKVFYKEFNVKFGSIKKDPDKIIKNKFQTRVFYTMLFFLMFFFAIAPVLKIDLWVIAVAGTVLALLISRIKIMTIIEKMPWNVILLVTTFFILISGFIHTGLYDHFVTYLSSITLNGSWLDFTALSFVVSILCGLFNNIPTTTILTSLSFHLQGLNQTLVAYALIIGSNVGANLTILGSLAGIMWFHLIKSKKYSIKLWDFTKYGVIATVPFVIIVSIIIYIEVVYLNL
jgi:arsenical pump membrane protein